MLLWVKFNMCLYNEFLYFKCWIPYRNKTANNSLALVKLRITLRSYRGFVPHVLITCKPKVQAVVTLGCYWALLVTKQGGGGGYTVWREPRKTRSSDRKMHFIWGYNKFLFPSLFHQSWQIKFILVVKCLYR